MSLSSNERDDDSQRQEEGSTIAEQQEESQPIEEDDMETQSQCGTRGVKLVGDKTIYPRRQRSDRQTQSLQDRIDISKFSDECKSPSELANFSVASLLKDVQNTFAILFSLKQSNLYLPSRH